MGGTPTYLIPAAYTGISSYDAHRNRGTPSSEPGTDYYMPTGTPLGAPARCRVVENGGSIYADTGRFTTVDDGTRWLRFLHLADWWCRAGDELDPGELFAPSGASGYGSELFGESSRNAAFWNNTGGDHVHVTAFRGRGYEFGRDGHGSIDFHALTGGKVASGASATPVTRLSEEDEMTATFINIQGKAGSHRGGTFAIMRDNAGKLFARFVSPSITPGIPTVPNEEYAAWAGTMPIK